MQNIGQFLDKYNRLVILILLGVILVGLGVLLFKTNGFTNGDKVEVLNSTTEDQGGQKEIVVEIAGAVEKPGVYHLPNGSRIEDLLVAGGGISAKADRMWLEKYINRATKLTDGQKVYIVSLNEQTALPSARTDGGIKMDQPVLGTEIGGLTNINTASLSELDKLPGIGPVYGQSIIEHRPYSSLEELVSGGAIKQSVFEKIKNLITY